MANVYDRPLRDPAMRHSAGPAGIFTKRGNALVAALGFQPRRAAPDGALNAGNCGNGGTLAIRSRWEPQIKVRRPAGLWHRTEQTEPG
jgi:hypothetical protein